MKKTQKAGPAISRCIVVISVLACLLFSVGEGLRLTPFPSSLLQPEPLTEQSSVTSVLEAVVAEYGPIDVPTKVRKRTKRQFVDFEVPPSAGAPELTTIIGSPATSESFRHLPPFSGSRNAGRAPPAD